MTSVNIGKAFSGHLFPFLFIFSRLGSALILFPGIGETYVPVRMRLMFAASLSFIMLEPLMPSLPAAPATPSGLAFVIFFEILVGIFFGTILRLIMNCLETVGSIVAVQMGLSNAMILNPVLASQSPLPSAFLSITGVTLLFISGLDHMLIRSLVATYNIFPPGDTLQPGDIAQSLIQLMDRSFMVGIQLSTPFLVVGLLMYVALGMMQKLMPQVQLFLVMLPVQIWGGLVLLAVSVAGIMTVWLQYFDRTLSTFPGH